MTNRTPLRTGNQSTLVVNGKKFRSAWLIVLIVLAACNNEKKEDRAVAEKAGEHSGHKMMSGAVGYADSVNSGIIAEDTLKGSPQRVAMATINGTHVHLEYSSPGVKGRSVWGGLVAYDKVWVTGAHKATSIQFSKDVTIGDKNIPAGQYALFTIPGKEKWTVIINSRYDQHLADDYDQREDLVRMEVVPETAAMVQRLTYTVGSTGEKSGEVVMEWEKLRLRIPFLTK